ncbi:MAG: cyclic nucleotide-binding domain-containing protein [Candidatus Eremiobacterota bacterium]
MGGNGNCYMKEDITVLPRGGIIARTSAGSVQVGAIPETIKDTMVREGNVPQIFLMPAKLFSFEYGISTADFEFPIYYNFYVKNRKTILIGPKKSEKKIISVIKEALYGPSHPAIEHDYLEGKKAKTFPKLKEEMSYFKFEPKLGRSAVMDDFIDYIPLEEGEVFKFNDIEIINQDRENYLIKDRQENFLLPKDFIFSENKPGKVLINSCYGPPNFGITVIGSGHGFDPGEKTTGFIIWINRRGILVDPPVNTTRWIKENRINPRLIGDLILTHCHADHDSGTLQKILEERKIRLHTTKTIKESFLKKYSLITDIPVKFLEKMFDFHPVIIGKIHEILSGKFVFKYSFHSIPTIWFETYFYDKSLVYSSDMFNHPPSIKEVEKKRIMTEARAEEFLNFPWNHSIIIHEAGIPPIHTPVKFLEGLSDKIKEKLYLIHVSQKTIPEASGLKLAKSGIEHTIICDISREEQNLLDEKMDIILNTDLFRNLNPLRALPVISRAYYEEFSPGDEILQTGQKGEKFYIIHSGEAVVSINGNPLKIYSTYDYFGETSIIFNIPRTASIHSRTPLKALVIEQEDLLELLNHGGIMEKVKNLAIIRDLESWQLFNETILKNLSATQKTELQTIMDYEIIPKDTFLIKKGQKATVAYLIKSGTVEISKDTYIRQVRRGDFLAKISFSPFYPVYDYNAVTKEKVETFKLNMTALKQVMDKNPGIRVKLIKLNPLNEL